jgi:hypothetical protein
VLNYEQIPFRKGRSLAVKLTDGTTKIVSQFNNVTKKFNLTNLGKKFYENKKDRFTVSFPVYVDITRTSGSIYTRSDSMASTTVDLGEIELSAGLSDADQEIELKRIATNWVNSQPLIDGERILLTGYETNRYDTSRPIQFNKLSFNQSGFSAVMHRPLTAGIPMAFDIDGACVESGMETNDNCVPYQLAKHITVSGRKPAFP